MRGACCIVLLFLLAGCAVPPPQLTAPQAEKLKSGLESGRLQPRCEQGGCASAFWMEQPTLKGLYDKSDWVGLAATVMRTGAEGELAYYYLGRSAEGLGYATAAAAYYRRSIAYAQKGGGPECCSSSLIPCTLPGGELARKRLAGLGSAADGGASGGAAKKPAQWSKPYGVPGSPVTVHELRNATFYDPDWTQKYVHLKKGTWVDHELESGWDVLLTAVGDIDGDGVPDGAFALMAEGPTAGGREYYLRVILSGKQGHVVSPGVLMGNRAVSPTSLVIKNHKIIVKADVLRGDQYVGDDPKGHAVWIYFLNHGAVQCEPLRRVAPLLPAVPARAEGTGRGRALRRTILNVSYRSGGESRHYHNGELWMHGERTVMTDQGGTMVQKYSVKRIITTIAVGDLDGDKRPDGASIVVQKGKNEDTAELVVLLPRSSRLIDGGPLGQFTRVTSLSIRNGIIRLTKLVPEDGINPYSKKVKVHQRFRVRKGEVEEIGGGN